MTSSVRLRLIPAIVFGVSLVLGLFVINNYHTAWEKEQSLLVSEIVSTQAANIERRLSRSLSATYILKSLLELNNGEMPEFERYAKDIITSLGGITNLQLAPNGVIEKIYPLKGHEKALGHNILIDDKRMDEAILAANTGMLTLAGPFELIQGGNAVIGRNPVYIKNQDNETHFWGFASALIFLDDLLSATELDQLKSKNYQYELSKINPDSPPEIFASSSPNALIGYDNIIKQTIKVPNGEWLLCMGRTAKPNNHFATFLQIFLVLISSALVAYLSYSLLKQPAILQQLVDQKTSELKRLAFYDPLTGLCNRRLFTDILNRLLSQMQRSQASLALLYLDLDQFKRINDTMGHEAGDQLLKAIAKRLTASLRKSDIVARIGGDEFCVILPNIKCNEDAGRVAEKILKSLQIPVELNQQEVIVTPSIGITLAPNDGKESIELLKNADLAMYSAKDHGRNNYQFFNKQMNSKVMGRLTLESELGKALINNEFILHYQPQICLKNNKVIAIEALIRWQHPERGLVFPGEFIQLAEDTSLIIPIGKWVLETACSQLKELNNESLRVAVNISAIQFSDPNLVTTIQDILEHTGLSPSQLELEITESLLMNNIEHASQTLSNLKALGITIAIDDFGTGYSSLAQLKNLPADVLKIDREFINDVTTQTDNAEITEVIITMAHKLGLQVIAEGVETEEQLGFLVGKGCDMAQGYLFGKPAPLDTNLDTDKELS